MITWLALGTTQKRWHVDESCFRHYCCLRLDCQNPTLLAHDCSIHTHTHLCTACLVVAIPKLMLGCLTERPWQMFEYWELLGQSVALLVWLGVEEQIRNEIKRQACHSCHSLTCHIPSWWDLRYFLALVNRQSLTKSLTILVRCIYRWTRTRQLHQSGTARKCGVLDCGQLACVCVSPQGSSTDDHLSTRVRTEMWRPYQNVLYWMYRSRSTFNSVRFTLIPHLRKMK